MALNDVKINRVYDAWVRGMLELRHEALKGKRGAERKAVLDKWAKSGRIQEVREKLRKIGQPHDLTIYDRDDPESCTVIYRKPLHFEGTKQEVLDHLYNECATRIYSDYDCTGRPFTRWYKVGYLGNNLWRVAESFGLDV